MGFGELSVVSQDGLDGIGDLSMESFGFVTESVDQVSFLIDATIKLHQVHQHQA